MEYCIMGELVNKVEERLQHEPEQVDRTRKIMRDMYRVIPPGWGLRLLGSSAIGLATPSSDVDLYVHQDDDCYSKDMNRTERIHYFEQMAHALLMNDGLDGELFSLWDAVRCARVPILRFIHVETGTRVDLSSVNGMSVENSNLLRMYVNSDPRVKWLVLAVQEWAKEISVLGNAPCFRPYAITWLVLFFLMQTSPPIVLPLIHLRAHLSPNTVAGWDCRFPDQHPQTNNTQPRIQLLTQFLKFMACLEFKNTVICPLTGELFPRKIFSTPHLLPACFAIYQQKVRSKERLVIDSPFCLQDPIELSHNVTKQVGSFVVALFIQRCQDSLSANHLLKQRLNIVGNY